MSFNFRPGYREHAERELNGHPDIVSSRIAAHFVELLAQVADDEGTLDGFRCDINAQLGTVPTILETSAATENGQVSTPLYSGGPTPLSVSFSGQINVPTLSAHSRQLIIAEDALHAVCDILEETGYFRTEEFSPDFVRVDIDRITGQSPLLTTTSTNGQYADTCKVYGHYLREPVAFGRGTFPSLTVAEQVNRYLGTLLAQQTLPDLRPDGKVHVRLKHDDDPAHVGTFATIDEIRLNIAHASGAEVRKPLEYLLREHLGDSLLPIGDAPIYINAGGDFDRYFVQADSGVSKVKDSTIITGGNHQLGTDAVWGKCMYKASSTLLPYAFALSRAVSEVFGLPWVSVSAHCLYGAASFAERGSGLALQVEDVPAAYVSRVPAIQHALAAVPHHPADIRAILNMPVTLAMYRAFNDVANFHGATQPWKRHNPDLVAALRTQA